jgi:hypothetical protein
MHVPSSEPPEVKQRRQGGHVRTSHSCHLRTFDDSAGIRAGRAGRCKREARPPSVVAVS